MIPHFAKFPIFSVTWWIYVVIVSVITGLLTTWWIGAATAVIITVSELIVDWAAKIMYRRYCKSPEKQARQEDGQ